MKAEAEVIRTAQIASFIVFGNEKKIVDQQRESGALKM